MARYPAYSMVYDTLKQEIIDGDIAIGELLPPEPELERRFQVSRTTIRKAVELLSRDGFVRAQQGKGTEVLNNKTKQNLNGVTSISETLRKRGCTVELKSIFIDMVPASVHIAQDLQIEPGTEVIRIQRIQLADGVPIAIMKNYLKEHMVPGIIQYKDEISSLYQFLSKRYHIEIESAMDRISAKNADFTEAGMLQVPIGTALLYLKRVCFQGANPVIADRISLIGERYEFEVNMSGRLEERSL